MEHRDYVRGMTNDFEYGVQTGLTTHLKEIKPDKDSIIIAQIDNRWCNANNLESVHKCIRDAFPTLSVFTTYCNVESEWLQNNAEDISNKYNVSVTDIIEAWIEMQRYSDILYSERGLDILKSLGMLANTYKLRGRKAGQVLRKIWKVFPTGSALPHLISQAWKLDSVHNAIATAMQEVNNEYGE